MILKTLQIPWNIEITELLSPVFMFLHPMMPFEDLQSQA